MGLRADLGTLRDRDGCAHPGGLVMDAHASHGCDPDEATLVPVAATGVVVMLFVVLMVWLIKEARR